MANAATVEIKELSENIEAAYERIKPHVFKTPLMFSQPLSTATEANIFLKLESEQVTGSLKIRGAFNKILLLKEQNPEKVTKGLVTASSGNHGIACIHSAKTYGYTVEIFVREGVSKSKLDTLLSYGAKVTRFGNDCLDAEIKARQTAKERDQIYISPYNDLDVIAGQGTIGYEIYAQLPEVDYVLVSVGGGSLAGGTAAYLKSKNPKIQVLMGLRFLAKGDFLSEVADLHGVSKARAAVAIEEFVRSVNVRLTNIRFPTDRNAVNELKRKFYQKCRIPNIIGAVDGTLIPIQAPAENEPAYVCRKNFHALNVQAVCDLDMRMPAQKFKSNVRICKAGHIVHEPSLDTLSDGTTGDIEDGTVTFPVCNKYVDDWILVDEKQISDAVFFMLDKHHKMIEGAAGVVIAALQDQKQRFKGKNVALVLCGANISSSALKNIIDDHLKTE